MTTDATTPANELPPMYDPTQVEPNILKQYLSTDAYAASPDAPGKPYSIVIPPPNVTAALHLGHALNNTLQDVLTRVHRMRGFNTLWMPGTDHAGIATQSIVDKRLQQEGKPALKEYKQQELEGNDGRGQFIEKVTAWKDEYEATITNQLKEMGCSCDWDRQRFTMDDQCAKSVREAFFQLFKDGLIYRGKRLVNWDPVSQTALADDEVEMQDIDGNFYYMKYPIVKKAADGVGGIDGEWIETGEFATVATTRPETMLGDTAIAVNPKDEPRAKYIGQFVKLPIVNRVIPIVGDDYVVIPISDADAKRSEASGIPVDSKAKMASGFLKVTPAHDPNDFEIGTRHDLAIINVMAPDASISIDHGWPAEENPSENEALKPLVGLAREAARKEIVKYFKANDLLGEVKPYRHAVGHSYRSHVPIEPYYTDQWYVKVTDDKLKGEALRALDVSQRQPSDDPAFTVSAAPAAPHRLTLHPGHLPDWDNDGSTYFVTFRVVKNRLSKKDRKLVVDACMHWHGKRMRVHLVTAMPDHIHVLFTPTKKDDGDYHAPVDLMERVMGYTTHEINKRNKNDKPVWQEKYVEKLVPDVEAFTKKWDYMHLNPVTSGMVDRPEDYEFSAVPSDVVADASHAPTLEPAATASTTDGGLTFTPERYAKTFQNWHENIRDWCISRQLWWGHRIPVWSKILPAEEAVGLEINLKESTVYDDHFCTELLCHGEQSTVFVCLRSDEEVDLKMLTDLGFTQDPDVLDTWFSSALWPLSTMGWPEQTPELAKWNPTSVLCTAREIITLWVSRMVMFNRYFKRGDLPFNDVFIHAMIQDGHGQKMSKSLGNGVDPMDIIHSHGADAMRYTLTKMTTQTQDVRLPVDMVDPHTGETFTPDYVTASGGVKVAAPIQERDGKKMVSSYGIASGKEKATDAIPAARNTSEKFDDGQRFANKIWNAFRFALSNLEDLPQTPADQPVGVELADRWILNQLNKTIQSVDAALEAYAFADYATAVYDFFWRDLCDWYIEIVKPTAKDNPSQQRVLATCLDASLRLLHPMMPFITERLWQAMDERVPSAWRGLEGFDLPANDTLIQAAWPAPSEALTDASAERDFELIREVIVEIRRARKAYNIPPRQMVEATTQAPAPIASLLLANRGITQPLSACVGRGVGPKVDPPAGSAAVIIGDVTVYLHGVIDVETEKPRLDKLIADKQKVVKTFEGRLSNKKYVENAPAHLVQETRDQQAAAVKELEQLQQQRDALDS